MKGRMHPNIIKVKEVVGTDFIVSRYMGEKLRSEIETALKNNQEIVLDFSGISGITQGFADETIGVLIRAFGLNPIREHVKIVNANDKVRLILNWVANYSKQYCLQSQTVPA